MISVEEALERVGTSMPQVGAESVALSDALGRVLAQECPARRTQPPFDVSAMDGYAVRYEDVQSAPSTLKLTGQSPAGDAYDGVVQPGETVRIFTGARVPDGADAIIIQEDTEVDGDQITFKEAAQLGRHIRKAGIDFTEGLVGLTQGSVLSPRAISLAAAMDYPWLSVYRKPRVALLATGDELVRPGEPSNPNQIISSNSQGLAAYVESWGGIPIDLGIAADTEDSLKQHAAAVQGADLFVTMGGASVGDHDLVQKVLSKEGLEVNFWKIAMRPGKPLIFGTFREIPMVGLPGNPVSALVCALLFIKPALFAMLGRSDWRHTHDTDWVETTQALSTNQMRQDYIRAIVERSSDNRRLATPLPVQDSSLLSALSKAGGLIVRAPGAEAVAVGERVPMIPFGVD